MKRHWDVCCALALTAFTAQAANSADSGLALKQESNRGFDIDSADQDHGHFYLGGGLGVSTSRQNYFRDKNSATAYKFLLGFEVNKNFSTEIAYINLGDHTTQGSSGVVLGKASFVASAVGSLPLGDYFSLSAKVGYASFQTTATTTSTRTDDFAYGVIAAFTFTRHFAVRGEYEIVGASQNVYDVATISGIWKF